jgi:hypothetical protein
MRIGIDFDDTLSDWGALLTTEAARRWGVDLASIYARGERPDDHIGTDPWRRLILDVLETELALSLPLKPGALEVTRALAERHELVILTARHQHEARYAERWILDHDLPIAEVVATSRAAKGTYALDLGLRVHFDDSARVFDSFVGHPCQGALLIGSVFELGAKPGEHVRSVESWHRFAELVSEIEAREG